MKRQRFSRAALSIPAQELAPRLLGARVVRVLEDGSRISGIIVETEAYTGVKDRGCQSFRGHRSPRNENMYAIAGTAYVYFTYGMHFMLNVVCGDVNEPVAVLVRAVEPCEGIAHMHAARPTPKSGKPFRDHELCAGPGKICQALRIARSHNGVDFIESDELFLEVGYTVPRIRIAIGPRVGVDCAGATWARRKLRFWIKGHPSVSRGSTSEFVKHADKPDAEFVPIWREPRFSVVPSSQASKEKSTQRHRETEIGREEVRR